MIRTIQFVFLLLLIVGTILPQQPLATPDKKKLIGPGIGAYTEDPQEILKAARKSIRSVRTLTYEAEYRTTGSMSTRGAESTGKISLSFLPAGNPQKAKMAASGTFFSSGSEEKSYFHTTFNGEKVERLRPKTKTVIVKTLSVDDPRERTLGYVTSFFWGGPYQLLMLEYLLDTPFELGAPVADYEGRTVVKGVLCHVVYVEYPGKGDGRTRRERWFLGVKDNLPRRSEAIVADNDGRYGTYELTLSNLRANTPISNQTFAVKPPPGYVIKAYEEPPKQSLLNVGESAPNWKLADDNGVERQLTDYRGKIVVLDFWATWCGPCIQAMPELQKVYDRFKDRGVVVFGINAWEESNAAEFMKRNGYTYGLLLRGEGIANMWPVPSLPTLYVVGPDGKIIRSLTGLDNNLAGFIESRLKEAGK